MYVFPFGPLQHMPISVEEQEQFFQREILSFDSVLMSCLPQAPPFLCTYDVTLSGGR